MKNFVIQGHRISIQCFDAYIHQLIGKVPDIASSSKFIMSKIEEIANHSDFEEESIRSKQGEVFLAYIDAPVKESDKIIIEDTFVGGEPIWLHENSIPPPELLNCGACKSSKNMKLLLQAFSPLEVDQMEIVQKQIGLNNMRYISADDDRVLYLFLCTKCQRKGNSVRCIRGVKKNDPKPFTTDSLSEKLNDESDSKDFQINPFDLSKTSDSNPFGSNPFQNNGNSDNNPFASQSLTQQDTKKTEPEQPSIKTLRKLHDAKADKQFNNNVFKSYLLYVEEETFVNKPDHLKLPKNLKIDKEALDVTGSTEEDLEKDPIKLDPRTEKLSKFLDDDVFQKFQEVVGYNPAQVLRYEIGGKPLYYAESKVNILETVPRPSYNPSSKRVFEMQLMPKLILDLEESVSIGEGMEWGTILVFTDAENYIPEFDENGIGYVEECVKVQWESRTD